MKKFLLIMVIVSITVGVLFVPAKSKAPIVYSGPTLSINGRIFKVEIADTEALREQGLSNRQRLFSQQGMLFVFDKPDYHFFWMKDMLIPLDMIFFDENWKIILVEKNLTPETFPKTFGGSLKSKYVLEINAGEADLTNLAVGMTAVFLNK